MSKILRISQFIQCKLIQAGLDSVDAITAARWLGKEQELKDSKARPGLPLRKLLRNGKKNPAEAILGQRQESNHRWFIDRVWIQCS